MIGATPLREVIGAYAFRAVTRTYLRFTVCRKLGILRRLLRGKQTRSKHLHCLSLIFMLRSLILAGHHNARGQVRDAYCRFCFIHMLPARPRGTININTQIFGADIGIHFFGFGHHRNRGGRGVNAPLRFCGGHALHTVCARFIFQMAIDLIASNKANNFFIPAAIGGRFAHNFSLPAVHFGIA